MSRLSLFPPSCTYLFLMLNLNHSVEFRCGLGVLLNISHTVSLIVSCTREEMTQPGFFFHRKRTSSLLCIEASKTSISHLTANRGQLATSETTIRETFAFVHQQAQRMSENPFPLLPCKTISVLSKPSAVSATALTQIHTHAM